MRIWKAGTSTEQGVSLFELMVALSVIAIATVALAPRFFAGDDLQHAARNLSGTIRDAYVQAIATRQIQRLCFDLEHGEYWVAPTCDLTPSSENAVPPSHARLGPGVRILEVKAVGHRGLSTSFIGPTGREAILFYPIGLAEHRVIHLEDQSHRTLSLLIHPLTGLVSLHEGELPAHVIEAGSHALH
jgi:prepilin-type N-terminal cleavage/methylation domain-containing protein